MAKPIIAGETVDHTDVMEIVADQFECAEPPSAVAQAWLDKHAAQIENAMHYAAIEYIAKHWRES
jgi:hypothetical protein